MEKYIIAFRTESGNIIIPKQNSQSTMSEIDLSANIFIELVELQIVETIVISRFDEGFIKNHEINKIFFSELQDAIPSLKKFTCVKSLEELV